MHHYEQVRGQDALSQPRLSRSPCVPLDALETLLLSPGGSAKDPQGSCPAAPARGLERGLGAAAAAPARPAAKSPSDLLSPPPSFIAFVVISSEDYLISSKCQRHMDLTLKLNNSLNNAPGRYFSQPVIFRHRGERSAPCCHAAPQKEEEQECFSQQILTQDPSNR